MKLDQAGLDFIRQWEGLKLNAYQCSAGVFTIGIGSTRYQDGTKVQPGDKLENEAQAYELFRDTIEPYETTVSKSVLVPLNQNQFNALVSFTYNIGIYGLQSSTLLKHINSGLFSESEIRFQWMRWNKVNKNPVEGLTNRRKAEADLYFS